MIGRKWLFRNKANEKGEVTRNKATLGCEEYAKEEGVEYGDTFAPVGRLEEVTNLIAYATYKWFKVYRMDVKSTFLNGILEEEVYIDQPKIFFVQLNNIYFHLPIIKSAFKFKKNKILYIKFRKQLVSNLLS